MHLLDPINQDYNKLSEIFEKLYSKNAIAFLGAGASITNKAFPSAELIDLYEGKISKNFGTRDISKFVDILQATPNLRRSDFDKFVVDQLIKLTPNEGHNIFVTIPWKQVITTNYDTLIEQASENAVISNRTHYTLKTIRNKKQMDHQFNNNEIVYIKLNGCKTDLSLYPLVFSNEDFIKQNSYYKKVLSPFKQFSSEIVYLSFGYSFTDNFAEKLLDKILDNDYRQKRLVYCIDPFVNKDKLDYYESQNISIVNISFENFFIEYQKWFDSNHKNYLKTLQKFTNPDNSKINIDISSRLYLDNSLVQLKDNYRIVDKLKKVDFYIGAEPNYQVIIDDFDIVKKNEVAKLLTLINDSFEEHSTTSIPKIILVNGDFGSGKTTFTLRSIKEYLKSNSQTLAFEITKNIGIKKGYLSQLIKDSSAMQFIFYCDNLETDSVFKSFNDLRIDLASEQYSDIKIIFISSIRHNILEKFKNNYKLSIKNNVEFNFVSTYNDQELSELVNNLKEVGLIEYRDLVEKNAIIYDLKKSCKGDSFITLYKLIANGTHYKLLQKAYDELTKDIKTAFKLTALIHRFNMDCPVSVIKNSIKNLDWTEFTDRIVKGDGKNILFQEKRPSMSSDPDLFFKTKHPVIAEALIKTVLNNNEKNSLYKSIFASLTFSDFNAGFIVDLIKNIRFNDMDVTGGQIDNYYEICKREFETSPHFMISYITNIEKKTSSIKQLEQCIKDIEMLEADLDYRNNRLIHRKGSLHFKIAKILFSEKESMVDVKEHLKLAEDWFIIKKQLDPSSNYSYVDYLQLLMWKLKNARLDDYERLELNLTLNSLFEEAFKLLSEDTHIISDLFEEYNNLTRGAQKDEDYLNFLLEKYQNVDTRPIACMLLYYYYYSLEDYDKCDNFIVELKKYSDSKEVVYFLFKYYGRNLHSLINRRKYFELTRYNAFLIDFSPMRYFYFTNICESYDYRWNNGKDFLNELRNRNIKQSTFNQDFFLYWCNEDGEVQIFKAEVMIDNKVKKVKIINPFFKLFTLVHGNYKIYNEGQLVSVKLKFLFDGIRAEIV